MANIFRIITVLAFVVGVSACGKAARPERYEGNGYPHQYPKAL